MRDSFVLAFVLVAGCATAHAPLEPAPAPPAETRASLAGAEYDPDAHPELRAPAHRATLMHLAEGGDATAPRALRIRAIAALAHHDDDAVRATLMGFAESESASVRAAALSALARGHARRLGPGFLTLAEAAQRDESRAVQAAGREAEARFRVSVLR